MDEHSGICNNFSEQLHLRHWVQDLQSPIMSYSIVLLGVPRPYRAHGLGRSVSDVVATSMVPPAKVPTHVVASYSLTGKSIRGWIEVGLGSPYCFCHIVLIVSGIFEISPINGSALRCFRIPLLLYNYTKGFSNLTLLYCRWVISAAHCISNGVQYKIDAGDNTRGSTDETFEQVREVQQVYITQTS